MTKVRFSARAETAVPIMTIAIVAIAHDGTRMPWLACVGSGGYDDNRLAKDWRTRWILVDRTASRPRDLFGSHNMPALLRLRVPM